MVKEFFLILIDICERKNYHYCMTLYYFILTSISIIVGFVFHRSDFCIAGAFRDLWLFKRTIYLKAILVSIGLNLILFEIFFKIGIIKYMPYPLVSKPNLGNLIGGIIFGIGMVCAGSCVVGVLYKMGTGSFISFIGFLGIIFGSCLYLLFANFFDYFNNFVFVNSLTITQLLGKTSFFFKIFLFTIISYFIYRWIKNKDFKVRSFATGFINPFWAGIVISIGSLISYILAGMPMGVTTTYTKIGVFLMKFLDNDFISKLPIIHKTPLNFYNYFLGKNLIGGMDSVIDGIIVTQLPIIVGIFLGSFISAITLKEFNIYFKIPIKQYILAFFGGTLMGIGARVGSGCNLWHIFGGLSILAINAIFFVIGLFLGSFFGSLIIKKVIK